MAKKLALFGGTFDPVHFGHLITARAVAEQCGFERITLVPTASPPHKHGDRAASRHRLAMLNLAIREDDLFEVCELELARAGPSYTYQTIQALRSQHGDEAELYWLIGADMLDGLQSWHHAKEVVDLAQLVVAARPPWQARCEELLAGLAEHFSRGQLARIRRFFLPTPLIDISSSQIRQRVGDRLSIRYLVPEAVASYIDQHGLYRQDAN